MMSESSVGRSIKVDESLDLNIHTDFWNPLVKRRELTIIATHIGRGTPSRREIREAISRAFNIDQRLIVIRSLQTEFGIGRSRIEVHIYNDYERLKMYEPEYILRRHEEKKKEEGGGE